MKFRLIVFLIQNYLLQAHRILLHIFVRINERCVNLKIYKFKRVLLIVNLFTDACNYSYTYIYREKKYLLEIYIMLCIYIYF